MSWFAAFRHELRIFFYSPLTYIFQFGFLFALFVCVFLVADFYNSDEASINLLLIFIPWIAIVLVPALAMRAWGDPYVDRSHELALSLPLGVFNMVIGKYLAGLVILIISMTFTLPFIATVYYLGSPDTGAVIAGYIASILLLALFYAIALLCSALAREPITAFISGVFVLLILFVLGWDSLARVTGNFIPGHWFDLITASSPKLHYDAIASGYIQAGNGIYFIFSILLFLWLSAITLNHSRSGRKVVSGVALCTLLAIPAIGIITLLTDTRLFQVTGLDLTEQKEHTVSAGTRRLLSNLTSDITATLYWSEHQSNIPASIKSHARRTQLLLEKFSTLSNQRITLNFVDPQPDTDEEIDALQNSIQRIPMSSGDSFFLGAILSTEQKTHRIPYFDIRRDRLLEQDLATALNSLTREYIPTMGIITPMLAPSALEEGREGFAFLGELKKVFDVAIIPYFDDHLPDNLDSLLVIQAPALKQSMLYDIDQFVMRGGGLIVLIDPHVRFDQALNRFTFAPSQEIDEISDLLLAYGIEYDAKHVIGDNQLASPIIDAEQNQMSYPYWMRFKPEQLSDAHQTTSGLNEIFLVDPGSFKSSGRHKTLINTTDEAGAFNRAHYASSESDKLALKFQPDNQIRSLAVSTKQKLQSAYKERLDSPKTHLIESTGRANVFAIADTDWILDPFALQTTELDGQTITRPLNDNITFLFNLIEYASEGKLLNNIRSRSRLNRPFTRVAGLFKHAEQQYRNQEKELNEKAQKLEGYLDEVVKVSGVERLEQLPENLEQQALSLRDELISTRRELRNIRRQIRENVDALGLRIRLFNLVSTPLLIALLIITVFTWRRAHKFNPASHR